MRNDGLATVKPRRPGLLFVVGALVGWLVVQNVVLLAVWSWQWWPAFAAVASAIFKVAGLLAAPALAAAVVAGGAAWLWAASARTAPAERRFEEVRHG
ncbi:MAG TPA: hypothetical protein VJY35_06020 [Candidatus Eisenbacteria bacterium]|nr:hypothetical protein [Candidatus Eisenbacteria bacterium]